VSSVAKTSDEELKEFVTKHLGPGFVVKISRFAKLPNGMSKVKYKVLHMSMERRRAILYIDYLFSMEKGADVKVLLGVINNIKKSNPKKGGCGD